MEAPAAPAAAPMPPEPCEAARLAAIGLGVALAFAFHEGNQGAKGATCQVPKEPVLNSDVSSLTLQRVTGWL